MRDEVVQQLNALNRSFYERFAEPFADSRGASEPGMDRALALADLNRTLRPGNRVLEVGCAQGRFTQVLPQGCEYTGVDFSAPLISLAEKRYGSSSTHFVLVDLMNAAWVDGLGTAFDLILARAVLHHLPGYENRLRVLQQAVDLLHVDGWLILANWQVLSAERFRNRLHPWESIGLTEADIEAGDCLLDWRRDGFGLRFVHQIGIDETHRLASDVGLHIVENYYADGREQNLTLYSIMRKAPFNALTSMR